MKKLLSILLAAIMLLSATSALAVNEDVSGKVMIYTSMYPFVIDGMDKALEVEFPNVDVEFFYGGTGTIQNKVTGEMDGGTLGCDMMLVADPSYAMELKDGGWLEPIEYEAADKLRFEYDEEGYWYPVRVSVMVLAHNPELKSAEELPKTNKDFGENPALKGRISMSNPLTSGTAMAAVAALSDKYGYEYFDGLGANNVMIESGSTAIAKLETGECDIIQILEESVLQRRKEDGSKISCIYPEDGAIMIPSPVLTIAEERSANVNIEACEAITEWLLSDAGQSFIVSGYMHSVIKDFPEIPYDAPDSQALIDSSMPVDWVRTYTMREEIRNEFQNRVTIAQ